MGLGVSLFLFLVNLLIDAGVGLPVAVHVAPLGILAGAAAARRAPDPPRSLTRLGRAESVSLLIAVLAVWIFSNLLQIVTVDDDYWLHTPLQARMLRGVIPPCNPFFPDLVLGGHYGRDLLVASTSLLSGRDIFGSQLLLTSFCHSLGLALLYLAVRRGGSSAQAWSATAMAWLGSNVAHRVGLIDFFQNNGAPTYMMLALLMLLLLELWRLPSRKLAVLCGALLGVYALVYETHFGLLVLTLLALLAICDRPARLATLLVLGVAASLAVTSGGAFSRLAGETKSMDTVIANQSQSVQMSFPKIPLLALRIQVGEIEPVSCGYRVGWGKSLLAAVDHRSSRIDAHYVRLCSWMVMRMHWLGVWLAPFSLAVLLRRRHRPGLFLWTFGAWAFLVPGLIDFGPIHEFEWYRWEFAAGYGLAAALGVALASLLQGSRAGIAALVVLLALSAQAGLDFLYRFTPLLSNPRPAEVLGLAFDSRDWLLRHAEWLRLRGSDLRALAWVRSNPQVGRGCFISTTGPPEPWGILFESTAAALADIDVLGHRLPSPQEPVGVPPFRISDPFHAFLAHPTEAAARQLGIDWLLLRSDDPQLEQRLAGAMRLVSYDNASPDSRARLLFQARDSRLTTPPQTPGRARLVELKMGPLPPGTHKIQATFFDSDGFQLGGAALLPPVDSVWLGVARDCTYLQLVFFDASWGPVEIRGGNVADRMHDLPVARPVRPRGLRPRGPEVG
jgi:hypothetical protein